jgi:hypothetical protein
MAACAWNLRKWLAIATIFLFWQKLGLFYRRSSFTQFALFVSLITIVSLKGFFRQDDVCTEHYLCTNIASVAYRFKI